MNAQIKSPSALSRRASYDYEETPLTSRLKNTADQSADASGRKLAFAVGSTCSSNQVRNELLSWAGFCSRLSKPKRSSEALAKYLSLSTEEQLRLKDVGYYVGGHFKNATRAKHNIETRDCLALDLDHAPQDCLDRLLDSFSGLGEYTFAIHSTRKHTRDKQRLRLVIPLTRDVTELEYLAIARWLAAAVWPGDETSSIEWFDDTTFEFTRVMFWPSVCRDGDYLFQVNEGAWVSPDQILACYDDPSDIASWPVSSRVRDRIRTSANKSGNPLEKPGIIGAFCRTYSIHQAMDTFIPGVYVPGAHDDRMTYAAGSSANGALIYDNGLFLFSRHESDPCYYQNCNAFDMVRIHLFGELDARVAEDVPITKRPSYLAMSKRAREDAEVLAEWHKSQTVALNSAFDEFDDKEATDTSEQSKSHAAHSIEPEVLAEIRAAPSDTIFLPGDHVPAPYAAERIFFHMGTTHELLRRGDAVVELCRGEISVLTPSAFRSRLNHRARKVRAFKATPRQGLIHAPKLCSDDTARLILSCRETEQLPPIVLISKLPLLVEDDEGKLCTTSSGYNKVGGGIVVLSSLPMPVVALASAAASLEALLQDFNFNGPGDRARALASLIAPALRMSGLIDGDALMTCVEANASQTGKGYLLKLIREIYGEQPYVITKRQGGVGSFDESLGQGLLSGKPFISVDNFRGKLDSQFLESALTSRGDAVSVRVPHRGEVLIDISRILIQLTSNGVEATEDAANRMLIIRLQKQPIDYQFSQYEGQGLLQHVAAKRAHYLSCVHAVVRYWHGIGKPTNSTEHTFREWVGALDWIVQTVWMTAPLLEGHEAARSRVSNPALSWLRRLAHALAAAGQLDRELSASELFGFSQDLDIRLPGDDGAMASDVGARKVGSYLGQCFMTDESVELDGIRAVRIEREEKDFDTRNRRIKKFYSFMRTQVETD